MNHDHSMYYEWSWWLECHPTSQTAVTHIELEKKKQTGIHVIQMFYAICSRSNISAQQDSEAKSPCTAKDLYPHHNSMVRQRDPLDYESLKVGN